MEPSSTTSSTSAENTRLLCELLSNFSAKFVANHDPWDLPPVFFLTADQGWGFHRRAASGYWEFNGEHIGIRSGESSSSTMTPHYAGFRSTWEFYLEDDTKTDWVMHEYSHIGYDRPCRNKQGEPSLVLEDEVAICKVFKKDATHETPSLPSEESCNADDVRALHLCKQVQDEVDSLLYPAEVDPTVHCDTHAESDDDGVWQHFTKIHTKDPGVVYAVCHHCDRALKVHCSKEHCISQLERHRKSDKCRSSCSNPATGEDREMLRLLGTGFDLYKEYQCPEVNTSLTQLNPWDLGHNHKPSWYVTTSLNRQTNQGCWMEKEEDFTGIRMEELDMQKYWTEFRGKEITTVIQEDDQMQMQVPQYLGLRRTLEFHHSQNDGTQLKMDWIMLEYQLVIDMESPTLFLQGDMVIRKVFCYDKVKVTSVFSEFNRWLNGDDDSEEYSYKGEDTNTDSTPSNDNMHGGGDRKRKRSASSKRISEVWTYFTKIGTKDPGVVYAVCHHCDRGFGSGRSTNGTSHLWRHKKSCTSKPRPATGNANDATREWEAEIWPQFLLLKNYGETEHQASGIC